MGPSREDVDALDPSSLHVQHPLELVSEEDSSKSGYEDFEEYNGSDDVLDSDMEGSILNRGRPKKAARAPVLPQRSEKRASKVLDSVMQDLKSLEENAVREEADRISLVHSDPHELYLSSEEDASLSDDYEGSLMEFEDSEGEVEEVRGRQASRASRRKSQEDTARVVSLIVVGKPQIVNIFNSSPTTSLPTSRHSMNLDTLTSFKTKPVSSPSKLTRRPAPLALYPASRRVSISSTTSYIPHNSNSLSAAPIQQQNSSMTSFGKFSSHNATSSTVHPVRKSSRLGFNNLTTLVTNHASKAFNSQTASNPASSTHLFLNSDPFAQKYQEATHNLPHSPNEIPLTPKTPNSLAAWKKGLSRTFSKATRKQSMNKLSQIYQTHAASSSTLSVSSISTSQTQATGQRSSTSHGHTSTYTLSTLTSASTSIAESHRTSTTTLSRMISNPESYIPEVQDDTQLCSTAEPQTRPLPIRSESMPLLSKFTIPPQPRPQEIVSRSTASLDPLPVPFSEKVQTDVQSSVKDWRKERRSFGIMRIKSVKK